MSSDAVLQFLVLVHLMVSLRIWLDSGRDTDLTCQDITYDKFPSRRFPKKLEEII